MLYDYTATTADGIDEIANSAVAQAEALVAKAIASSPPSWANTIAPLEEAGTLIGDAYGRSPFMARVHPDKTVRDRATEIEERLTKWGTNLVFRSDLFEAVRAYADTKEAKSLTGTKARLVEFWLRDFRRAGHELTTEDQAELQRLQQRLIELQVEYSKNLDEWEDSIDLTRDDLVGLPSEYIDGLATGNTPGTLRVGMAYPDYIPFLEQAERRYLRKALQFKFWNRASQQNQPLLAEAVKLRRKMASLFGLPTWAHFAMELKMAKTPETVTDFYESIVPRLRGKRDADIAAMTQLLQADGALDDELGGSALQSWDSAYYATQLRKRDFGIDQNEVARYFPLEQVVDGMFEITGEVFGLEYRKVEDAKAWHPDVNLYEIRDTGADEPLAYFYADLFPREGKFGHAAAFPLVSGQLLDDGSYRKPIAAIVANFTKPTESTPSLLKHDEALTLFHEFGHILHYCLTTVDVMRFAGFDTEWDFVEAPSQIMEHWMWQPEVLQRFARHHETGDPIPDDLVERLVAARDLNVGLFTMRQIFLGKFDMNLHGSQESVNVDQALRNAYELTGFPFYEGTHFGSSFGHLMGGYDAGYYGYLWSKVYGDDMFSVFKDEGILSPEVGRRYRNEVLAMGHSRDAIDHLRAFLGREPSTDAFLEDLGLQ
ncbi:MAG: M3 family metallopeptidase [Acidimicrobiia bacterium]|nr:M3 family metallopeptidase [Acidimicrobiia bacterium]MDX2467102.1 M3 family metallopeptidase [Acidimicrobiia bacterium]